MLYLNIKEFYAFSELMLHLHPLKLFQNGRYSFAREHVGITGTCCLLYQ